MQTHIKAKTEKSNYPGHWGTSGDEIFKSKSKVMKEERGKLTTGAIRWLHIFYFPLINTSDIEKINTYSEHV